jgi:preprotein translocase subunit SecD
LSGLFVCALLGWTLIANPGALAEQITIDVASAEPAFDARTGQPLIAFKMTEASTRLFADLTSRNVGRKMEIRVDGRALMAPVIREPILGGSGQISDRSFTVEQTKSLAERLSTGKSRIEFAIVPD